MSAAVASRSDLYDRAGLTDKQREAVELCDAGKGYLASARVLGISVATVRARLAAAELKIRKLRNAA